MSDTIESIEHTFNAILQIMHDPERYVLLAAQINFLADQIRDYQGDNDDIWYIGEGGEFTLSDSSLQHIGTLPTGTTASNPGNTKPYQRWGPSFPLA